MSELPPSGDAPVPPPAEPREHRAPVDEGPVMPSWVPIVIGVILVTIAALAVYTGMRFRNNSLVDRIVKPRRTVTRPTNGGGGAPGEPGPGASLVFPGETGDNAPAANAPVSGRARAEISGGGPGGVTSNLRLTARRGMLTHVTPDDAMIYVNDLAIGEARQHDAADEVYDFPAAGSYTVKIAAPGYEERQFTVTASETAKNEIAVIDAKLTPVIR